MFKTFGTINSLCAEEKFPFEIFSTIVETERNSVYVLPFESRSIFISKIIDTNPSIQLTKEIHQEDFIEENSSEQNHFLCFALSPNQFYLVTFGSNRTIFLYENCERIRPLARLRFELFGQSDKDQLREKTKTNRFVF